MSRHKLKVSVGLLTGHTTLITPVMFKFELTWRQDCRLCGGEKKYTVHIVCHCPGQACKRYRTLKNKKPTCHLLYLLYFLDTQHD